MVEHIVDNLLESQVGMLADFRAIGWNAYITIEGKYHYKTKIITDGHTDRR